MNLTKLVTVMLTALLILLNLTTFIIDDSEGTTLNKFTNGESSDELTFDNPGEDVTLRVNLPKGSAIRRAYVNITGLPTTVGNYPLNPRMDLGLDGDFEWGFNESGYGSMGYQTKLIDDSTSRTISFYASGSDSLTRVQMPKGAEVSDATMNLQGLINDYGKKTVVENNRNNFIDMDAGDIDGDGDVDIVVIAYWDRDILWYNNTNGDGTAWTRHTIEANFQSVSDFWLADLNGDGALDVAAAATAANTLAWYNNTDGTGRAWSARVNIDTSATLISNVAAGDMDNDTDMDLVCTLSSSTAGRVVWYNNTNGDASAWTRRNIGNLNRAEALDIADIDDDGDNDTVVVNYAGDDVVWYENINNASSWSAKTIVNNGIIDVISVTTGDIDEDGHLDVIALGRTLRWFEAPDILTNPWTAHTIATPGMNSLKGELAVGDLGIYDSPPDGHLDVAMVTASSQDVRWYENDDTTPGSSFTGHTIRPNHGGARCLRIANIGGELPYPDFIVSAYGNNIPDDLVWYEPNRSYPKNVRLDVGGDGDIEYSAGASWLNTTRTTGNFATELNQLLASGTAGTDGYGNKIMTIPLKVITDMPGRIIASSIDIKYEYTATAEIFPGGTLADELQDHVGAIGSGGGSVTVPLKFTVDSAGKLRISDIFVEYNNYPTFSGPIPNNASIEEDMKKDKLIDLSPYFSDDYLQPSELTYEIVSFSNNTILDVYITDSIYLGIDSEAGDTNNNWYGKTEVQVRALDEDGLEVKSNVFIINVTPVNDEPLKSAEDLPPIILKEGQESDSLFLVGQKVYFYDIEYDDLYFDAEIDPEELYANESIELVVDEEKWSITIIGLGNWTGSNIPLRVYCDDDPDVDRTIYKDTIITVTDVDDDAPIWLPISIDPVYEGSSLVELSKLAQLTDYVYDIDNDIFTLSFDVVDNTNESAVELSIDSQAFLKMNLKDKDFFGITTVTLRAMDPGGNSAETTFDIDILPVNDAPTVALVAPPLDSRVLTDTVVLSWTGHDVDNDLADLTYSIYFDDFSGETLVPDGQNLTETSFRLAGLENGLTYFWRAIPHDGDIEGESGLFSFSVQLGEVPRTILDWPKDGAIINQSSITLDWSYSYIGSEQIDPTFDLYFEKAGNSSYTPGSNEFLSEIQASKLTETEFNIDDLEDGETYYWTVIPQFAGGEGICSSGIWSFKVDLSAISYGFQTDLMESTALVERGDQYTIEMVITNHGVNYDIIEFEISAGLLNSYVSIPDLDENGRIVLNPLETRNLNILIDAVNAPVTVAEVRIDATSKGDGSTETETLALTIEESEEERQASENELFGQDPMVIGLLVVVAIVIVILVLLMVMKSRKKAEDKEDEDDLRPVSEETGEFGRKAPQMYEAELIGGPMSIGDVVHGGAAAGAGSALPGAAAPAPGGAPAPVSEEVKKLPPKTKVIRKQKKARTKSPDLTEPYPQEPFTGEIPPAESQAPDVYLPDLDTGESAGDPAVSDVDLPDLAGAQDESTAVDSDFDFSFKRPGEAGKDAGEPQAPVEEPPTDEPMEVEVEKKKEKKRGPKIRLPGE
jgi:hypothetical protein